MIDKKFVESFLRLNGVPATARVAEIQTLLVKAGWPQEQVKEALLLYTSDATMSEALAEKKQPQAFRPDMDWSSSKISSLLGTDVILDPSSFRASLAKKMQFSDMNKKIFICLCIATIATLIAVGIGIALMYFFEVGPFYKQIGSII
jgi:ABC-type phosphate/phosphonate transport system permease subunit